MPAFQVLPSLRETLSENRVLRLCELLDEARREELEVRRELDGLRIAGEVEVFPMGDHLIVKTTEAFDPDGHSTAEPPACLPSDGPRRPRGGGE